MSITNHFICYTLLRACSYITVLACFVTSISPSSSLYADEQSIILDSYENSDSKELINDPTKKLRKLIKELESFTESTTIDELKDFLKSFRSFAEKDLGLLITSDDMYKLFRDKVNELNIPINPKDFKSLFSKKHKGQDLSVYHPKILLGCVFLACSPLVAVIGVACPVAAPTCGVMSSTLASTGVALIAEALCEGDNNRKNILDTPRTKSSSKVESELRGGLSKNLSHHIRIESR